MPLLLSVTLKVYLNCIICIRIIITHLFFVQIHYPGFFRHFYYFFANKNVGINIIHNLSHIHIFVFYIKSYILYYP